MKLSACFPGPIGEPIEDSNVGLANYIAELNVVGAQRNPAEVINQGSLICGAHSFRKLERLEYAVEYISVTCLQLSKRLVEYVFWSAVGRLDNVGPARLFGDVEYAGLI